MPSSLAVVPHRESPPESSRRDAITVERFVAAAAAGLTIALIVGKDHEAAAVYYFRDGLRAFAAYERLGKLSSLPLVVTLTPEGRLFSHVTAQVESALKLCGLGWLPGFSCRDGGPRSAAAGEAAPLAAT